MHSLPVAGAAMRPPVIICFEVSLSGLTTVACAPAGHPATECPAAARPHGDPCPSTFVEEQPRTARKWKEAWKAHPMVSPLALRYDPCQTCVPMIIHSAGRILMSRLAGQIFRQTWQTRKTNGGAS